jgi:hypothetical protein
MEKGLLLMAKLFIVRLLLIIFLIHHSSFKIHHFISGIQFVHGKY